MSLSRVHLLKAMRPCARSVRLATSVHVPIWSWLSLVKVAPSQWASRLWVLLLYGVAFSSHIGVLELHTSTPTRIVFEVMRIKHIVTEFFSWNTDKTEPFSCHTEFAWNYFALSIESWNWLQRNLCNLFVPGNVQGPYHLAIEIILTGDKTRKDSIPVP